MKNNPKVSIIINCYNGEKFLSEAISSIYNQSYGNWEIIFYDNCSTDSSAEIAKSHDSRLKYYSSVQNVPLGEARNNAISLCDGDWIAFLDVDDYWLSHKLQRQIDSLMLGDYCLCYAGVTEIDESGKKIRDCIPTCESGFIFEKLLMQFDINMVTPMVNRKFLEINGLNFNANIFASEEYNLFTRMAAKGDVCVLKEVLGVYRVSNNSLTYKSISKWAKERFLTIEQIKLENEGVDSLYSDAFNEAESRGYYYSACYFAHNNDFYQARKEMKKTRSDSKIYRILYFVLFFPFLWKLINNPYFKRKLLEIFC